MEGCATPFVSSLRTRVRQNEAIGLEGELVERKQEREYIAVSHPGASPRLPDRQPEQLPQSTLLNEGAHQSQALKL